MLGLISRTSVIVNGTQTRAQYTTRPTKTVYAHILRDEIELKCNGGRVHIFSQILFVSLAVLIERNEKLMPH